MSSYLRNWSGYLFSCEVKVNVCVLVHKRLFCDCPVYIEDILRENSNIHDRNSRYGSINLVCPRFKRETEGGRSFSVRMARLWNALPNKLKVIKSVNNFKKALINFYVDILKDIDHFTVL